ncbi:sulfatase [Pontiella sulfatireligans]|uniref:Choline-sulfatase n=1 Tax=Pontiella sulfatireligans TaxID=2750658 RepID=A0A6C2UFR5_9BACT|nr:sulfatase [Pontiella sulfatireligans]SPS74283.1 sulfatase S1_7 [Kiritimatiellales bacterium]VGO19010.1 Choline-sulfatase [Pontiella sulfatireligans]
MKRSMILAMFALAAVSISQAAVICFDGFETAGPALVGRSPDQVNEGSAAWVTSGGGATAAIVDVAGDKVMEVVNTGADSFALDISGEVVFGQFTFDLRFTSQATDTSKNANFRVVPGSGAGLNDFKGGVGLGTAGLGLDTWGEVAIVFNAGTSEITYGDSNQYSVPVDAFDIWVNGQLDTDNQLRTSNYGGLDCFGFKMFDGVVGMEFQVDDFELNTAITVGGVSLAPSLVYSSDGVNEAVSNDGSISSSLAITLSDDLFTADVVSASHGAVSNTPAGLTPVLTRDSDTQVTLSFTGNATDHTSAESISNLMVSFADGAFVGGDASAVAGSIRGDLSITFADAVPPNILMLCIDDMNDWVGFLGGHPQTKTPNMDALAEKGVIFSNAHCPAPGCSPSRSAIMFGAEPTTTGLYPFYTLVNLDAADLATLDAFLPMPQFFRDNGYYTAGYTKVWHNPDKDYKPTEQWDVYKSYVDNSLNLVNDPKYYYSPGSDRLRATPATNPVTDFKDRKSANSAVGILQQTHDKPFFLAVGFILPHTPFVAPVENFDRFDFPIEAPPILAGDLSDVPLVGRANAQLYADIPFKEDDAWEKSRRGYLASISFTDDNVGVVLDALAASPYADNTVVVLWSDHGFHLGEKQTFSKFSLWEEATRTPFIIYDPRGNAANGQTIAEPVGLINIYRTLADLTGLTPPAYVDGISLVPWLDDPSLTKTTPALTTWGRGNYTVRSCDWRYTRYHDGSEELYHNAIDPNEWMNLADDPEFSAMKTQMAVYLPTIEAPQIQSGIDLYNVSDSDKPNNRVNSYLSEASEYETLGLQPPLNGYEFSDWVEKAGYTGDAAEPGADPNTNGVPNILEYAIKVPDGGDVRDYLPGLVFEQVETTNYLSISFRRRLDAPDLLYEVDGCKDLSEWDPLWSSDTPTNTYILSTTYNADGTQTITVRHRDAIVDEPVGFLRHRVSAP